MYEHLNIQHTNLSSTNIQHTNRLSMVSFPCAFSPKTSHIRTGVASTAHVVGAEIHLELSVPHAPRGVLYDTKAPAEEMHGTCRRFRSGLWILIVILEIQIA